MIGICLSLAFSVIYGGISCFFGKKLYFPLLTVAIFLTAVSGAVAVFGATWRVGLIAALVGLVIALLAKILFWMGMFLLGGMLGAGVGLLLTSFLPAWTQDYTWIGVLLSAVVLGCCAVKWSGLFIMAATAYNGAFSMSTALCFLILEFGSISRFVSDGGMVSTMSGLNAYLRGPFLTENTLCLFVVTGLATAAGFSVQYARERRESKGRSRKTR